MIKNFISSVLLFIGKRSPFVNKLLWDYEYSKGEWDFLRSNEMTRLNATKELLRKNVQNGNILEIGCGEGVFYSHVLDLDFASYEGIDVSEVAINKIAKTESAAFFTADMEVYVPKNAPFSVIILNEVLFYSKKPISLLLRYRKYLKQEGVFLIGMFNYPKTSEIWSEINDHFTVLESVDVVQGVKSWNLKIIK